MIYPIRYIKITQYPHKNNDLSIDFGKEKNVFNTPILACDDGIVKRIEYQKTGGNVIFIDFNSGYRACYGHLKNYIVNQNQRVEKGQIIGYMGQTGITTGPHLHFGLYDITPNINYGPAKYDPLKILTVAQNQIVDKETKEKYHLKYKDTNNDKKELYVYNVDEEGLVVRNKPNGFKTGELLQVGTKVLELEHSNNWTKINQGKWVYNKFLTPNKPEFYIVTTPNNKTLNVRNKPSLNSQIIKTIKNNTHVSIYKKINFWVCISPTKNHWISQNFIKKA